MKLLVMGPKEVALFSLNEAKYVQYFMSKYNAERNFATAKRCFRR